MDGYPDRPRRAARQESLREHNLALVARTVLLAPEPPSRADVAARTGLNRATVSRLVAELVAGGLLSEDDPVAAGAGRPATPLRPAAGTVAGLGLEINIDFVGARLVDLAGRVVAERMTPGHFRDSAPDEILGLAAHLGRQTLESAPDVPTAGTGLALPGLVRENRLLTAPNLDWHDLDPADVLIRAAPELGPVTLGNEARLAALAELATDPAASFLYVSGEVGIGAAIVRDGEIVTGVHGFGAELGHLMVDPGGHRCRCGATGCLETVAGTDALLEAAGLPGASMAELAERLVTGEAQARAAVERAATALGQALAAFVNLVDVPTIVLGNTLAQLTEALRPGIEAELGTRVLAARWAPPQLRTAAPLAHPALTGAARAALAPVVDDPSAWLSRVRAD
ncbi:ROK family transcriptional regulator [Ruania rhizosphaerae]|uniref:ROK family transcriptional regulator n=1 Tax=Ruania rhizosphaerae TaxID=1840413 RepID=UPI001356A28C|nr:ROK family transcriptional regulator [Ruania rhizosphaerae]